MKCTLKKKTFWASLAMAFFLLTLGYTNMYNLASATEVNFEVASDVQVTQINYFLKNVGDKNRLFVHLTLKNLSDSPKRYRVLLSIPGGSQVGGFVPRKAARKGMKPAIEPNNKYTEKFYFAKDQIPDKLSIRIATFE